MPKLSKLDNYPGWQVMAETANSPISASLSR